MKMTRLIYPLAFAAALTLLGTGCKHKPTGLTPIPGPPAVVGNNPDLNNVPPINQNPPVISTPDNPVPIGDPNSWQNMLQDRTALAAYTVHFKFDSAAILGTESQNLDSVASALKSDSSAKLLIEGNCDERGTEEYNRSLGERRAIAARDALSKDGVDAQRIFTQSYGKDKPADSAHDDAAWAKNRRDEFVLLHPKP